MSKAGFFVILRRTEVEYAEEIGGSVFHISPVAYRVSDRDAQRLVANLQKEYDDWQEWLKVTANEMTFATGERCNRADADESDRGQSRRGSMMDRYADALDKVTYTYKELTEEIIP